MATRTDILDLLLLLRFYPNSPVTEESIDQVALMFEAALADLPGELVLGAAVDYIRSPERFFPMPGTLRALALDRQLKADEIPAAAEAWGMVVHAEQHVDGALCPEGYRLWEACNGKAEREYWKAIREYSAHRDACTLCFDGGYRELYPHPIVEEVVRRMGGRDVILTDNLAADRARFFEGYNDLVERIRREAERDLALPGSAGEAIRLLAARLRK